MLGVRVPPGLPVPFLPGWIHVKERLQRLNRFLTDVRGEVKRTTFPSTKEVQGTTIVVIVTSMIFAGFLFVVDFGLRKAIDYLFEVFVR